MFVLYNSLTNTKEEFVPLEKGKVHFYSCGPTVYNVVHIGNLRSFVNADILYRWLTHGMQYDVKWVMNITDVDDKTIRDSKAKYPDLSPDEALRKFTRHYEDLFFADLEKLHISKNSFFQNPRATESIEEMQQLTRNILDAGIGYEKDGSIYFSLQKYTEQEKYGTLMKLDLSSLKTGTRTLADEIEKDDVQDFVLWKGKKEGEPAWDFEYKGKNYPGRPGWHIECSAMAKAAFGKIPFDIHSGGVDLKFPHHEDEIAQAKAGYKEKTANFWVHNEHLMVEGKKMSKSLGNFYTLQDLVNQGHSPDVIRYVLATNHYRTKFNFSQESLQAAAAGLERIRNFCRSLQKEEKVGASVEDVQARFCMEMCDDLNTPKAIAVLFEALSGKDFDTREMKAFFMFAEHVFGIPFFPREVQIPEEILFMAEQRKEARDQKNWEESDRLRDMIFEKGYVVRDEGTHYDIVPRSS